MIISGRKIRECIRAGTILIDPLDETSFGPNSVNLTLHNELLVYNCDTLDMAERNPVKRITIPENGFVLRPGELYLGRTVERTRTDCFVPMIEGRSSVGRLGVFVHVTAGFGDVGFDGAWTLEIACVKPIRIRPGAKVCQIYFHTISESYDLYDSAKYQGQLDIVPSRIWREFTRVMPDEFFESMAARIAEYRKDYPGASIEVQIVDVRLEPLHGFSCLVGPEMVTATDIISSCMEFRELPICARGYDLSAFGVENVVVVNHLMETKHV
jgi:dCTP deaminase